MESATYAQMLHSRDFAAVAGGDLEDDALVQRKKTRLVELMKRKASSPLALRHQSQVLHQSPESPPHRGSGSGSSPHPGRSDS